MTAFVLPTTYQGVLYLVLTLVDGLLFGIAIKKGILAFVILILGVILGTYIGLSLPGVSISLLITRAISFMSYYASHAPAMASGFPIFFIIGLAIGIWKG